MELETATQPQKHSVFDNYVPIIVTGRHTDIYLHDTIDAPCNYTEACRVLSKAYSGDNINIHMNNGGGYVDSGFMLIDAIKHSKATVTGVLTGSVASITTIVALQCDEITVSDHISWLSHNYSAGVQGKGGEMKAQMEFMSAELAISFKELHKGFFTESEMEDIIEDKDMWLNKVEIEARWAVYKARDQEALEALAEARKNKGSK